MQIVSGSPNKIYYSVCLILLCNVWGEQVSVDLLEPIEQIGHACDIEQLMERKNNPSTIE